VCDIRNDESVHEAVALAVKTFGGIDIVVNNASAIWPRSTPDTPMKRFDGSSIAAHVRRCSS